jgi:hypothetical protein
VSNSSHCLKHANSVPSTQIHKNLPGSLKPRGMPSTAPPPIPSQSERNISKTSERLKPPSASHRGATSVQTPLRSVKRLSKSDLNLRANQVLSNSGSPEPARETFLGLYESMSSPGDTREISTLPLEDATRKIVTAYENKLLEVDLSHCKLRKFPAHLTIHLHFLEKLQVCAHCFCFCFFERFLGLYLIAGNR